MSEEVYDKQIAPLMTKIIEICKKHKLPVFASFEYDKEKFCTTSLIGKEFDSSPIFAHFSVLIECMQEDGINIDKYLGWIIRGTKKGEHRSVYLKMLEEKREENERS